MHFFSPANIMRLVEIVRGRATVADVIATARSVARRMGKLGVVVGNCFGFVGNRMLYAYGRENQLLLLEGASPAQIDAALESFGMAMGPNAVGDLAGLDVGYRVRRERKDLPDDPRYYRVADMLVEAGRLGQKTGRGTYLYPQGARRRVLRSASRCDDRRRGGAARDRAPHGLGRGDSRALPVRADQRGRALAGRGHRRSPPAISMPSGATAMDFRAFAAARCSTPILSALAAVLEGVRRLGEARGTIYWTPAPLLEELGRRGGTFQAWRAEARREEAQVVKLQSYVRGDWLTSSYEGVALRDASTGEVIARASSGGLDFAAVLGHAREVGGPASARPHLS